MALTRRRNLGLTLAGVWFVLTGITGLVVIVLPTQGALMALLALAAGILLIMGK